MKQKYHTPILAVAKLNANSVATDQSRQIYMANSDFILKSTVSLRYSSTVLQSVFFSCWHPRHSVHYPETIRFVFLKLPSQRIHRKKIGWITSRFSCLLAPQQQQKVQSAFRSGSYMVARLQRDWKQHACRKRRDSIDAKFTVIQSAVSSSHSPQNDHMQMSYARKTRKKNTHTNHQIINNNRWMNGWILHPFRALHLYVDGLNTARAKGERKKTSIIRTTAFSIKNRAS